MFKKDYKSCFDSIKGDDALLKKILKQADKLNDKRVHLKKIYQYSASVAAALVVVASSAFLYNNGMLKADLEKSGPVKLQAKSNQTENKAVSEALITDSVPITQNITEEKSVTNKDVLENTSEKPLETPQKAVQPVTTAKEDKPEYENIAEEVAPTAINADISIASAQADVTAKAFDGSEINTADNADNTNTASEEKISSGGGGGGNTFAMKRATADTTDYTLQTIPLPVFKEGIDETPESEHAFEDHKTLIYTDNENIKRIEVSYYPQKPDIIINGKIVESGNTVYKADNTYSAFIESSGGYIYITAENISEEYMNEIVTEY